MRKVTYGGAVSLDGFLAGADGAIDWLHFSADAQKTMTDYWKDVDTILMGRKTYEDAMARSDASKKKPKKAKRAASKKPAMRTYIFSRTLATIDQPGSSWPLPAGVELVKGDAAEFVRDLKRHPGKGICLMGGGELAQSLLAADLVDEIGLNIHPILLGAGIPTFRDPGHRVKLKLVECRPMDGGCVLARYRVEHAE